MANSSKEYTVLFTRDYSIVVEHEVYFLEVKGNGRPIIPSSIKKNLSILAVIEGAPNIVNKLGDRELEIFRAVS
ncbi:hypothetical protein AN214_03899 [Pseudoalteromonas sp. P1-9]|uniref:DUF2375 family protein n=1 Tax=Pseudoalteromonas sp. P1-9 TaxID=1710354 RepID=UPI0006D61C32|nr:DUF2375 family protein [Pseudoalteromonas sp. P1-9]KPV94066.1 hypothetical protein AN214_03899 [Pseudoalteromonas sp. P1-9]